MNKPDTPTMERVMDSHATTDEIGRAVDWFGTDEGQRWLADRMDSDAQDIQPGTEEIWAGHSIPSDRMYANIVRRIRAHKARTWCLRAAAILLPLIILAAGYMYVETRIDVFAQSGYDEITVPTGECMQLQFQDGSKVFLNSGSHIRYPRKFAFGERRVSLEGEGWFEVAKAGEWPFVVDLGNVEVKVLGTTFNVKAYPGDSDVDVALKEGHVSLAVGTTQDVDLRPGQRATYDRTTGQCTVSSFRLSDTGSYDWRTNKLMFRDTPLGEVLKRLSQTYGVQFKITDPDIYRYTYTLTSSKQNLTAILNDLEKITPLTFRQNGDTVVVSRK